MAPPLWWSLPVLGIAGLIIALAIERLPGRGGHIPAHGLVTTGGPTLPIELPGIMLAAIATIGLGLVLGPEAPLIALGSGLGVLTIRLARKDAPPAGDGSRGGRELRRHVVPLPVAADRRGDHGRGDRTGRQSSTARRPLRACWPPESEALISIGLGSWTGLSTSAYALGSVEGLPKFLRPDIADFGWTIALAVAVALALRRDPSWRAMDRGRGHAAPVRAAADRRAGRRRSGDRLPADDRQALPGSPVFRSKRPPGAVRQSRRVVESERWRC